MGAEFSHIGVSDRTEALNTIVDHVDTMHLPETIDRVLHNLLHKQMLHTIEDIANKLIHGGYVIDQIKNLANELSLIPEEPLDSSSPNVL